MDAKVRTPKIYKVVFLIGVAILACGGYCVYLAVEAIRLRRNPAEDLMAAIGFAFIGFAVMASNKAVLWWRRG